MISVRLLLGQDDRFNDLLAASAAESRRSFTLLIQYLEDPFQLRELTEFTESRRRSKTITAAITDELCTTFVTTLDKEDIGALSVALHRIPKTVEKIAERIRIAPQFLRSINLSRHTALLAQAADILLAMLTDLRTGLHMERIASLNEQMQDVESEADKALGALLRDLYNTPSPPVRAVFLKDILELLEKVFDRCRDAGIILNQIVLKNS